MTKLNRYWARWYEPKADPIAKARIALWAAFESDGLDHDAAGVLSERAIAALTTEDFEINWPFWDVPEHPHMTKWWISGEAASGAYCVVCAVFDAPDEQTIRAEIGERQSLDIELRADGWTPGDRFSMDGDDDA